MGQLAFQIAGPMEKEKVKKVVVADLLDSDTRPRPEGKFLAEKLAAVLVKDYPTLEAIDSGHSQPDVSDVVSEEKASQELRKWAKKLGAKAVITGNFSRDKDRIRITLKAMDAGSGRLYEQTAGLVPISEEMKTIFGEPLVAPKGGIARAGVNGVSMPVCLYCPLPSYTEKARAAKYQGTVVLQVVVTTEGRAENIVVVKGPGMGLEVRAIEAAKLWRFRPADGPDGHPIATLVPIQVTFRLHK